MVKGLKFYTNFKIMKTHKQSILLIGNFDGLHLGHQKLFNLAKNYKKKFKLNIGVITFEPMPKMYFNKNLKNFRISNILQKIEILKKLKIDFLVIKKFDKKFSKIKYHYFIEKILYKKLNAKYIFVSNNFRFGNKREGDVKLLKSLESKYNYKIINPKPLKKKNKLISSTLIRKLISKGNLKKVNNYLNRNWSIEGKVLRGRKMAIIGFLSRIINLNSSNFILTPYRNTRLFL